MIGKEVTVRVRSRIKVRSQYIYQPEIEEFFGTVYPLFKWQIGKPLMNLTTGDPRFPVRTIELEDLVSIDGGNCTSSGITLHNYKTKTHQIEGSKGNVYTVTESNGRFSCDCVGFGFRNDCKHVKEASGKAN